MLTFTMTQLTQATGEVTNAVDREPATITSHGRAKYVMLRAEDYERLIERHGDPRRVLLTEDTPDDIASLLADDLAALDGKTS